MSHRPSRAFTAAGGAVLALSALTGCGEPAGDAAPEKRGFGPVPDRLAVTSGNGDLDIRPADVGRVEVTRWFSRWSVIGSRPKATWDLRNGRLTLATDCGAVISGCDVRYRVLVPRNVALTIDADNGAVSASGFGTALQIRTDNGAVTVAGSTGPLSLRSQNGNLRATGIRSRRVDAASQSGEVHLSHTAVPDQANVTTENGAVILDVPKTTYKVTTTTDNGEVHTDVPRSAVSPHTITVRTDNGAITVRTSG
jgi:hypothetical protein